MKQNEVIQFLQKCMKSVLNYFQSLSKKQKKIWTLSSLVLIMLIVFTIVLQGTNATPRDVKREDALTTIGNLEVKLNDKDSIGSVSVDTVTNRKLTIENKGETSQFLRIMVFPTLSNSDNFVTQLTNQDIIQDWNTTDWTDGNDGYYYYKKKLKAGKSTDQIFSQFKIPQTKNNNGSMKLTVKVEATTAAGYEYRKAFWGAKAQPTDTTLKTIDGILDGIKE